MGVFFGTDGIRGKTNIDLTYDIAFKCGNSLSIQKQKPTIIIGQDTRISGRYFTIGFSGGALSAGANVIDVGVCPTAGIAYLTKQLNADYGVVISASHNPAEYNGIKIFDSNGYKLGDKNETILEKNFLQSTYVTHPNIGTYTQNFKLINLYINYLVKCCNCNLNGLKIVIDASNGASYNVAPKVFKKLGAKVICTSCRNDGVNINKNCGSLHPEKLSKLVVKNKANLGFAFDGDSDRIIACDENGQIIDGDIIIYMLAKYLKSQNNLNQNIVVGTRHTNMGIEEELNNLGITLIRADIGDKYVMEKMLENKLNLGGEKSGHIILSNYATTGDGVLSAIKIAELVKISNCKLSELSKVNLYPQCNIDCIVKDKIRVINSDKLCKAVEQVENELKNSGRVMVRVSGTEPKIRIMVECKDYTTSKQKAEYIEQIVKEINQGE